jgi:hypothetical protein
VNCSADRRPPFYLHKLSPGSSEKGSMLLINKMIGMRSGGIVASKGNRSCIDCVYSPSRPDRRSREKIECAYR